MAARRSSVAPPDRACARLHHGHRRAATAIGRASRDMGKRLINLP